MRPDKTISGLTLAQFLALLAAAEKTDGDVSKLESQLKNARTKRKESWRNLGKTCTMVSNAVKGDPSEGADGDLIQAIGYKKESEKKKAGPRRPATQTAKAA